MGQLKLDLVSKIPKVDFEYGLDGSYSPIYLQKPVYDYTTLPWQSELQTKHEGRQLLETNEGKRTQFPERSPKNRA